MAGSSPFPAARFLRELRRAVSWHRRWVAAALAAAGAALALHAVEPQPAPTTTVLAAARDLPGGAVLAPTDVREVELPRSVVPDGALRPGDPRLRRMLATPVRAGEPLTDARLLTPTLLSGEGRLVAAPVRVADPGTLSVVQVGDRIDVLAAWSGPPSGTSSGVEPSGVESSVRVVARSARVLALPGRAASSTTPDDSSAGVALPDLASGAGWVEGDQAGAGGLVVLAVPADTAAELAEAAVTARLSFVLVSGR